MWTLGIETSERAGAIALVRELECIEERPLPSGGRRHAQSLVAEVDVLLRAHGLTPRDCGAVAVSIGPGSFTGLRVGVVCAKTFAYATGCRVAAVETFAAIAEDTPSDVPRVWVIADAQRGELYIGHYAREAGAMVRQGEILLADGEAWCAARRPDDVVTGPAVGRFEDRLTGRCRVLPPDLRHPRAGVVARIGARQIQAGRSDDLWTLQPLYIRKSAAEEKWDAAQG